MVLGALPLISLVAMAAPAVAATGAAPKPIPGGLAPGVHIFAPSSTAPDTEPSAITDFKGFSALAYVNGTAMDTLGKTYTMKTDMRVFQGHYVAEDGVTRFGTFGFI